MTDSPAARPRDWRLAVYVAVGALLGGVYVLFDIMAESRLERGTLTGTLANAHEIVDHVSPLLVGALLGVCLHYVRLRARLARAEEAASRAEALRARLQKVERDQAVWVLAAAVLHELNNPLHALGLLLDELASCSEAERGDLTERARSQANRALAHLRMLRSMRNAGEPELQRVALDRLVEQLARDMGPLAGEEGVKVLADCREVVVASADPHYVRTILENLVDNSLQALKGDGGRSRGDYATRTVTIGLIAEGGRAVVRVGDDGPPLDPDVRAILFEPLRTTKAQGLGLGLSIARALARAMRGDLSLDDGAGKVFRLELPLRLEREGREGA